MTIKDLYLDRVNPDYVESLLKLKLTGLYLCHIPENLVIKCVMGLTLKNLNLHGIHPNFAFTKQILECGPHLMTLNIVSHEATIDLEDYNSLLALATKNKTKVKLELRYGKLN